MSDAEIIAANVERIQAEVAAACRRAGRSPEEVTIVGVTKSVGRETADTLVAAGIHDIAENRVQDAMAKFGRRGAYPPLPDNVRLHMIGNTQTNKAKDIVGLFSCVHALNRQGLADALHGVAARRGCVLPVLIEVNTAADPSKEGAMPDEMIDLMGYVMNQCPSLDLRGLMTIAPLVNDPEAARPAFSALHTLRNDLQRRFPSANLATLSMGMSNDFPIAVEEGATHLRIGRALFAGIADSH